MARNNVSKAPYSDYAGDPWLAMELLPEPVRHAMQESVVMWCPGTYLLRYRQMRDHGFSEMDVAIELVRQVRTAEWGEVRDFARRCWHRKHGPYPALAAKASIQRYEGNGVQRGRRGGGAPP